MNRSNIIFTGIIIIGIIILSATSCKKSSQSAQENNGPCNATAASVQSMTIFPSSNQWNADVSAAEKDPYSDQIIAGIGSATLKADFGSGLYGMDYSRCSGTHRYFRVSRDMKK